MAHPVPAAWYQATCADLTPKQFQNVAGQPTNPQSAAFATLAKATVLWDVGTNITYAYLPGDNVGTANQQAKVNKNVSEWSKYAGISFSLVDAAATPPPSIRITFDSTGNWSALGNLAQKVPPSQATMNLACIADTPDDSSQEKGVILHEFGHALGLAHEYSFSAPLDVSATKTFYESSQGWADGEVQSRILDVYNAGSLTNYLEYDANSVMKNFMGKEMITNGQGVSPNTDLSDRDKAYMVINYPRLRVDLTAAQWTLSHALDIIGVPAYTRHAMLLARPDDLRKQFAIWQAEQRMARPGRGAGGGGGSSGDNGTGVRRPAWYRKVCTDLRVSKAEEVPDDATPGMVARAVFIQSNLMWPNETTLTFSFLNGSEYMWDTVESVIQEWTNYANVTFVRVPSNGIIRIAFNSDSGTWCYDGQELSKVRDMNQPTMSLSDVPPGRALSLAERGTILHEFGHALGLLHEHQSPARGGRIHLNEPMVYQYYADTQGWTPQRIKQQIIDVYNKTRTSNYSEVDPSSIMMYAMPREMNLENLEVRGNYVLSEMDKAYVVINYPFQTRNPAWTLSRALDVAGVTGPDRQSILAETDADLIRYKFSAWNARKHAAPANGGVGAVRGINAQPGRGAEEYGPANVREAWCSAEERDRVVAKAGAPAAGGPARGAAESDGSLWEPGETITYFLEQEEYRRDDAVQRRNIKDNNDETKNFRTERRRILLGAFDEWREASGLKFKEVLEATDAYVKIFFEERVENGPYVTQSRGPLSWSRVGRECLSTPNPAWKRRGGNATTTCYLKLPMDDNYDGILREAAQQTCRHEIGHMLGLRHEHVSPLSKVHPPSPPPGEQPETSAGIVIWTDWDPHSVMLYRNLRPKNADEPPLKRQHIPTRASNVKISAIDKAFVQALYARNANALEVAATQLLENDEDAVQAVMEALGDEDDDWYDQLKSARRKLASELEDKYGPTIEFTDSSSDEDSGDGEDEEDEEEEEEQDSGAEHGVEDPVDPDTADGRVRTDGEFLPVIIESLKKAFNPGGNQSFTLQFPGRFLQISQYAWDTGSAGVYGQFIKPLVVNESEFRLTDQLYDVADVVSGPNGISLSQVYDQLINNLLPVFRSNGLAQQQDQIRQWLLREVKTAAWIRDLLSSQHTANVLGSTDDSDDLEDDTPGTALVGQPAFAISDKLENGTVNRMELSNALMQEYLQAKQSWEVERDAMLEEALKLKLGTQESASALNSLTRKLAHTTAIREAQLASKYSDAVVRGYSHNVREYVGYLDVKSAAEALQDAKDSLREAAMSSMDGSLKVFPVQMTPIDWFEGLSTSFKLEDLTQDPDLIYQQIRAKSQQLDVLNQQLTALRFGTKGDPVQLRNAVSSAQDALDTAQATLATKYTTNVIAMVKTCYTSDGALDEGQVRDLGSKGDILPTIVDTLIGDLTATSTAQTLLTKASRAYTQALAGYALAEATDTQQQQEQIRLRVESITAEVNELTARYTSLNKRNERPEARDASSSQQVPVDSVASFPVSNDTAGGSRWQQIEIHHRVRSDYTEEHSQSSASSSSMHVNLWLLSASTSQSQSQGSSSSLSGSYENDVTVGFRTTLVTVDRAGWFQPQFFKQSGSFYHIDPAVSWSKAALGSQPLLPAFPIGYVLCKDITIKISTSTSDSSTAKQVMSKDAAASGGVLCFSYSQSSSSSSSDNSYSFQQCSDGCVIRIPGPQILGYMMQHTDPDKTTDMPKKLPSDFFIPDADYDAATQDTGAGGGDGAAHGIDEGGTTASPFLDEIDGILKKSSVSAGTMAAVHAAMRKEFEKLSEEVGERVKRG